MKYIVVFIPTNKGIKHFGWEPTFIAGYDNKADADERAYLESIDDPVSDSAEYGYYKVFSEV